MIMPVRKGLRKGNNFNIGLVLPKERMAVWEAGLADPRRNKTAHDTHQKVWIVGRSAVGSGYA
jgi:hypothetical protein